MSFVFPEGTFDQINQIRGVVGRIVTINVIEGNTACPDCTLDPITNTSTDSFCETCDGLYWTPVISGYATSGHVRWLSADQNMYTPGGIVPEGDCKVTIQHTDLNMDRVERSNTWVVDSKTLYPLKIQVRGIRGPNEEHRPSRIKVFLKEEED